MYVNWKKMVIHYLKGMKHVINIDKQARFSSFFFILNSFIYVFLQFLGHISCQTLPNIADIEDQLQNIPGLEKFNASSVTEEDLEKLLKEKCVKAGGGEEAYLAIKNQKEELQECLENQVNTTEVQMEITEAKKTGSMDEVFGKYCKKFPEIYKCMANVTNNIRPCLEEAERETLNRSLELVQELKEFICYKDGDRIASKSSIVCKIETSYATLFLAQKKTANSFFF